MESDNNFKAIFKNTSILGFTQIIVIIVAMVKSKLTSGLIGPIGMGLVYILTNMTGLIGTVTNFGFGTIAIKNISKVTIFNNTFLLARVINTYWKLAIFTGSLGTLVVFVFSDCLSKMSFGNSDYTKIFMIISITLLFAQINTGQFVVLQSLRYFKKLAYSNLISGVLILIANFIVFYFFGIKGVATSILLSTLIPTAVNWLFIRNIVIKKIDISSKRVMKYGRELITLGTLISLSRIMPLLSTLVLNAFIIRMSGLHDVGLYNAGFAIIFNYTGIVFTAMEGEYFSRLSTKSLDKKVFDSTVNKQVELALLLITPIVILFVFFANYGIVLLYSKDFLIIENMIRFAMMGLFFKCLTWPLSYIFLVKNMNKFYFWNEFSYNFILLGLNIFFYNYKGISGLGYSFFTAVAINLILVLFILKIKCNFRIEKSIVRLFLVELLLIISSLISYSFINGIYKIIVSISFIFISIFISYYYFNLKLNILKFLKYRFSIFIK